MQTKSGFITIVGKPNVGKSTLLNALIGEKIAITSPKVQTTRFRITGILTEEDAQFVFIDTPGMHKPIHGLGKLMDKSAENAMQDVDIICWVVDQPYRKSDEFILERIKNAGLPTILVINKIDELPSKGDIDKIIVSYLSKMEFESVVPISAKDKTHLEHLKKAVKEHLIEGPLFYPEDYITDQSQESRMGELIRERILYYTEQEVPHSVAVVIESMKHNEEIGTLDVDALIIVERDSQKGILIGKGGEKLKRIGTEARKAMNQIFDLKVHLTLWVKVQKDWRNNPNVISKYGYGE
ncbi:GTPase Era [Acholeplasma equirhinis]|nr:GTPase Era [Acholeplasma equirhinis]MBN3490065.1 GTPase Era [Acholeplasma equirhinis]